MKTFIKTFILLNLTLATAAFADNASQNVNVAQEAMNLKYELDKTIDDAAIKLVNDPDFSGPRKEKALDSLTQLKMSDADVAKAVNDPSISDAKKSKLIKKMKSLQKKLDKKINKAEKKVQG